MKFKKNKNLLQIRKTEFIFLFPIFTFLGLFFVKIGNALAQTQQKTMPKALQFLFELWVATVGGHPEILKQGILGDMAKDIIGGLVHLIWTGAAWILGIFASLFTSVLSFTVEMLSRAPIHIGWSFTRDFVNMFFILGLVVIAFATILRFEQYEIKRLLPKFIVIALLINFSYVICGVIIDFTHILTNFFVAGLNNIDTLSVGAGGLIQSAMIDLSGISQTPQTYETALSGEFSTIIIEAFQSLFLIIAAIILLIGAVLLVVRVAGLWILIILAPFAWFFSIFPGTKGMSNKWWNTFLKWAFFAPIYIFFIYLAIMIMRGISIGALAINAPSNFTENISVFTEFVIAAVILFGAPIVAMSTGIYGSRAVLNFSKKAARNARTWAWKGRPATTLKTTIGAGALTAGGRLFGGTRLGRRMRAQATQLKQVRTTEKWAKKFEARLRTMSGPDKLAAMKQIGTTGFMATKSVVSDPRLVRSMDTARAQLAVTKLRKFGENEAADKLEELRPDAIKNDVERNEAIERAIKEGTHKKWSKKVFEDPRGAEIVEQTRKQLGTGEFVKVFKGWAKEIRDEAGKALQAGFTNDFKAPAPGEKNENIERRKAYAKITGKINEAFFADNKGGIQAKYEAKDSLAQQQAKIHIQGLKDEDFGNLDLDKDKELAAKYMMVHQVAGAGTKLSGTDKELFRKIAKEHNKPAFEQMQKVYAWGGSPTGSSNIVNLEGKKPGEGPTKEETMEKEAEKTKPYREDIEGK